MSIQVKDHSDFKLNYHPTRWDKARTKYGLARIKCGLSRPSMTH